MSVKGVGRASGKSAVAAAAYRSGEKLEDKRQAITHDYTKKSGVEFKQIYIPNGFNAEFAKDRETLWNRVEQTEKRKDASLAREFEIAFPCELNKDERQVMLDQLCQEIAERHQVIVDAAIHAPHTGSGSDERNYHAHILFTSRNIDLKTQDFATKKNRDFNKENSSETVCYWRERFAEIANHHLELAGYDERIDHRSYAEREIKLEPTQHEGSKVTQLRRMGINTEISLRNDAIKARNAEYLQIHQTIQDLDTEIIASERIIDQLTESKTQAEIENVKAEMRTITVEVLRPAKQDPEYQEQSLREIMRSIASDTRKEITAAEQAIQEQERQKTQVFQKGLSEKNKFNAFNQSERQDDHKQRDNDSGMEM